MFERLKKATAPTVLLLSASMLRGTSIGADTKDRLWKILQRYAAYFDVFTEASLVNGMKVRVSSNPRVEQEIFLFGEWEPLFTRYLRSIPPNDGIFLDIGANIGYFSLVACSSFREVHAIEASPSTNRRLVENIAANNIDNIHVYQTAVGGIEGHIDFYQNREQSGGASVFRTEASLFEASVPIAPVEVILDGIDWGRVRFVKIDVEGLEAPVLDSLLRLRTLLHPGVEIFVEYSPDRRDSWPSIKAFLENGFSAFLLQGPYDRRDYLEPLRRSALKPVNNPPVEFCDILIRRDTS